MASKKNIFEVAAVLVVCLGAFCWAILPNDTVVTVDGFYHFTIARLIATDGPWVDISWLPFTILKENGADHHWLWHVIVAPISLIGDQFAAFKWSIIYNAMLVVLVLCLTAKLLKIPFSSLFALLAIVGGTFMPMRLLMLRAQNISICFLSVAMLLMLRGQNLALGIVSFFFIESYHGAVILGLPLVGLLLVRAVKEKQFAWRPLAAVAIGCTAGLVINPWFPGNIEYLFFQTIFKYQFTLPAHLVGTEWEHQSPLAMLTGAWPTNLALAAGITALIAKSIKTKKTAIPSEDTLIWLFAALAFLFMYRSSCRFIEYYAPFGCIAAGLLFRDVGLETKNLSRVTRLVVPASMASLVFCLGLTNLRELKEAKGTSLNTAREITDYLDEHGELGEIVFNSDYSDFVYLLWHTRRFRYVVGLDSSYLAYGDPQRFNQWLALKFAKEDAADDPAIAIRNSFESRWAVVQASDLGLFKGLIASPAAKRIACDKYRCLFQIDM